MPKKIGENEYKDIVRDLESLGLKAKEALVYISLLELGEVGSSHIAKKTGLHTQFIYMALDALEKHGLTQHVIRRGRKKFSAKHPQALVRLVEQQKRT
ncbi:helix-turn-helix domain-containing protein, partial [Staphylococcus aureus]|uniref:helix-turn-helix domain-containing protein n=1 Tax=Staphylococcus aureus TaxID=1280 RepID=UPI0039BE4567